ncbi:MAG: transcriptional regulator NrdR [Phycisphaerales bacterium]
MICPFCSANDDKVIDSRASEAGRVIRRRRQCLACDRRFTTYERVEDTPRLTVIKRDGKREAFQRDKISAAIRAACGKRPIAEEVKLRLVEEIEDELHRQHDREVETAVIGQMVAERLRSIDDIAYVRYASEYYKFRSVDEIMAQLEELSRSVRDVKGQQMLDALAAPPMRSANDAADHPRPR